jgi:hypothetical protein
MDGHVPSIFWPMKLQSSLYVVGNYLRNHEYDSRQPTLGMMRLVVHLSTVSCGVLALGGTLFP